MADITVTPANVFASASANVQTGVAGAAITAGQALFKDTLNAGVMKLADADGVDPANVFAGISLHGASTGQPIAYAVSDAEFTFGGTANSGDTIWLSDTPGGITKTFADLETGDKVTVIGIATSSTKMRLSPVVGGVIA